MSRGRYGNACIGTPGRHEGAVIVRESLDILAIGFNRHMGVIFAGRNSMQLDIELQYDFLFSIRRLSREGLNTNNAMISARNNVAWRECGYGSGLSWPWIVVQTMQPVIKRSRPIGSSC